MKESRFQGSAWLIRCVAILMICCPLSMLAVSIHSGYWPANVWWLCSALTAAGLSLFTTSFVFGKRRIAAIAVALLLSAFGIAAALVGMFLSR